MNNRLQGHRKLLVVAPDFYPVNGGYANAVTNFVKSLLAVGSVSITVVTLTLLGDAEELSLAGLTIKRIERYSGSFRYSALVDQVKLGRLLNKYIHSDDFDFVLFESFENPVALWIAIQGLNDDGLRKVSVRIHATTETEVYMYSKRMLHRLYWFVICRVIRRMPNILSTTNYYIDFVKQYPLKNNVFDTFKNYGVVPNITGDVPAAERDGELSEAMAKYTFFALGRMNELGFNQKNFDLIAQAVYVLKEREFFLYRDISIVIVGDGDYFDKFEATLCELNVRDRFILKRYMNHDQVRQMQSLARAVILVSRYEGQSMFALESLAAGSPLILSAGTGVSDLVEVGKNGFLVNYDDPYSLAEAMEQICDVDIEDFRSESRKLFSSNFSTAVVVKRFFEFMDFCRSSAKSRA